MSDVILTTGEDVNLAIKDGPTLKFYDVITIENVINVDTLETLLLTLPNYANEAAAFTALGANKLYWISSATDTEFPFSLKKTRPA